MQSFYSNGKLLITGEYVVLDGALSLTLPTKFGQSLEVLEAKEHGVAWKALDNENKVWLTCFFRLEEIANNKLEDVQEVADPSEEKLKLLEILHLAHCMNKNILKARIGYSVKTKLDFPKNWGLGTSSTLINNISQWFRIDPYELLERSFGGSGYDIAAAQNIQPITYQINNKKRSILKASFDPIFENELFFVHLNRKQNSRDSIQHYRGQTKAELEKEIKKISCITSQLITTETIEDFKLLIEIHENIISKLIKTPKVKSELFADYSGTIKSLGGWGGDFILVTGSQTDMSYFTDKGYNTIVPYSEMIL